MIAAQKIYNEEVLKKTFFKKNSTKSFSVAKNYLYHAIIRSGVQHISKNKDSNYYLAAIQFLYDKSLFDQAGKILKPAFKLAEESLDYLTMLKLIDYTKAIVSRGINKTHLLRIEQMQEEVIHQLFINMDLKDLSSTLYRLENEYENSLSKKDKNKIENTVYEKLQKMNVLHMDKRNKSLYHENSFLYGRQVNDELIMVFHSKHLKEIIHDPSFSKFYSLKQKFSIIYSLIFFYYENEFIAETQSLIDVGIKSLSNLNNNLTSNYSKARYALLYNMQLLVYLNNKELSKAEKFVEEKEKFFSKNKKLLIANNINSFAVNKVVLLFFKSDYTKMLQSINLLLYSEKNISHKEPTIGLMSLEMIALLEQEKNNLLESRLNSYVHFLKTRKMEEGIFKLIAVFFKQVCNDKSIALSAKEFLSKVDKIPPSRRIRDIYYIFGWFKDKSARLN